LARPAKSLATRVAEGKFKAREHRELLAGPLVGPKRLQAIQRRYREAASDRERRAVALEYESALRLAAVVAEAKPADVSLPAAEFFPAFFRHMKGPAAGRRFVLEEWQARFVEDFERRDEEGLRVFKRRCSASLAGTGSRRRRRRWRCGSSCSRATSRT
jgi:hypothetical protein